MKRRKQETVTTYISTLTVNLGNNQPTKFKSNKITSESHNTAPKQHHVYPSTTHNSDAPQPYRQAQTSSGTYYQLTKSSLPNSNKEQPEPHQEASENPSFRTASKQHHDSSTAKYLSSSSFDPPSYLRPTGGPYETTYTASFQGIRPHTTPYTLRPITLSRSYEFPSKILQGSSSGLESSLPNSNKELPEPHQEAYENTSYHRGKTYFEELSSGRAGSSGSKSFTQYDQNQKKSYHNVFESVENMPSTPEPSEKHTKEETSSSREYSRTSTKSIDSLKTQLPSSSSTSITKKSTGSTAVSKEITTTITTTTTEEKKTLSGVKTEVKSTKPTTDYGETDWYLDLLLRMQALEMKQQNLHVQYDFLGKLANENKENLKQARDWARYDADNYQVEAY